MLAGVLLPLCLAPVGGLIGNPWAVAPVLATWLVAARVAPRWAVPLAFVSAATVSAVHLVRTGAQIPPASLVPRLEITAPTVTAGAVIGLAVPLFLVTMASQNVPGVAIMRSFGYRVPWRPAMLVTGLGTAIGAPAGGHAINLTAITAALAAGPEADPDPNRRWVAGVSTGMTAVALGGLSAGLTALAVVAPAAVIPAVAGVALLGAFGSAVQQAIDDPGERLPAVATFLVAASGVQPAGIGAAFWALIAGLVVRGVLHARRPAR
ncbi:hypothetical protein GCM10027411_22990 [Microbacterium aureliae]